MMPCIPEWIMKKRQPINRSDVSRDTHGGRAGTGHSRMTCSDSMSRRTFLKATTCSLDTTGSVGTSTRLVLWSLAARRRVGWVKSAEPEEKWLSEVEGG